MAKLIYIRDTKEKNILILGILEGEDKNRYTVNRALYSEIGMPAVGEALDCGAVEEIAAFDERYRAKKKALSLLSIADNNKNGLFTKLRHAGYSRDVCEETVAEMLTLGYIDEDRQLERLILSEAKKLSGKRKISSKLQAKGYLQRDISRVLKKLEDSGEIDFSAIREQLIEKHFPDEKSYEEIKKLLYKNGF